MERHFYGIKPGVQMVGEDFSKLLPDEARAAVEELAIKYQKLPVEPSLDRETGEILKEEAGTIVNIEKCIERLFNAQENEDVPLAIEMIYPQYSSADLARATQTLGYFETYFSGSRERRTNITMAATALNNLIIWPGQGFSFNEVVGPRTPERGYLPAPVIISGAMDLGFGGGVCQVSTTVYNAALSAQLKIIERHGHSKRVHYISAGRDATVDYGHLDLKFMNNRKGPIIIKSGVSGSRIWVRILGEE
ncbi:MAG: VanW family protein [Syntrophomonadaceae bacterium]